MTEKRSRSKNVRKKKTHEESIFNKLHKDLLECLLKETETLNLHPMLKAAANEAASLAWSSEFPLLVYPVLLAEKVQAIRLQHMRRENIKRRSQALLEEVK